MRLFRGSRGKLLSSARSQQTPAASTGEPDYYALLGVLYTATTVEISRAYRGKMKGAHPDHQQPNRRGEAEERAKQLNLAFTILSKPESRRGYDARIKYAAVQDQIMNRYVGGFSPTGHDVNSFGKALRGEQSEAERSETRRADQSATASILIAFGGITLFVILLLLAWATVSALFNAVF